MGDRGRGGGMSAGRGGTQQYAFGQPPPSAAGGALNLSGMGRGGRGRGFGSVTLAPSPPPSNFGDSAGRGGRGGLGRGGGSVVQDPLPPSSNFSESAGRGARGGLGGRGGYHDPVGRGHGHDEWSETPTQLETSGRGAHIGRGRVFEPSQQPQQPPFGMSWERTQQQPPVLGESQGRGGRGRPQLVVEQPKVHEPPFFGEPQGRGGRGRPLSITQPEPHVFEDSKAGHGRSQPMTQPESQVPPTFGQSQVRGGFRGGRGGGLAQLHIGGPQITAPPPPKEDVKIVAGGDSGRPRRASEVKQQQQSYLDDQRTASVGNEPKPTATLVYRAPEVQPTSDVGVRKQQEVDAMLQHLGSKLGEIAGTFSSIMTMVVDIDQKMGVFKTQMDDLADFCKSVQELQRRD